MWHFAFQCYTEHQSALLHWQDQFGLAVNDLLLMAYALRTKKSLSSGWWQRPAIQQTRVLIARVRRLRREHKNELTYASYKKLELELEGVDLMLLSGCLGKLNHNDFVLGYEKQQGIKKGTLAPFIEKLAN
ncbi:MAG: DUF2390 domain-containing protein [Reinekea sp.]